jgi:hypothetical protein
VSTIWFVGGDGWVIVAALAAPAMPAAPIRVSAKRENRMNIVTSMVTCPSTPNQHPVLGARVAST